MIFDEEFEKNIFFSICSKLTSKKQKSDFFSSPHPFWPPSHPKKNNFLIFSEISDNFELRVQISGWGIHMGPKKSMIEILGVLRFWVLL